MSEDTTPTETRIDGPLSPDRQGPPSTGQHLATVSHDGLLWDVYVESAEDPRRTDSFTGRLCFAPPSGGAQYSPVRTAAILIEPSYEEMFYRARAFEEHHLVSLLRSILPDEPPAPVKKAAPAADPDAKGPDAKASVEKDSDS